MDLTEAGPPNRILSNCTGRGIWQTVGNSWTVASKVSIFEFMPLLKGRLYSLPKQNLFHISRKEFLLLFRNTCRQCEACLEAGGWHFETLISVMAIWIAGEK